MHKLYKYRGNINIENELGRQLFERDIAMILRSQIWCSRLEDLNDPFEGSYKLDLVEKRTDQISNFLDFFGLKEKSLKKNIKYIDSLNSLFQLLSKSGIYSLSQNYDNELLWSHYSNSHYGFCIEYEFENLEQFNLKSLNDYIAPQHIKLEKVNYKPFKLDKFITDHKEIRNFLFHKGVEWSYEKEWRIVTLIPGLYQYNNECIKSLTFGLRTTNEVISSITTKLQPLNIDFYQMKKGKNIKLYREML